MKEKLAKYKDQWGMLSLREKQASLLGGIFLVFFILYQFIWSPFLDHISALRQRISIDQETLAWMQSANKIIQKIESQRKLSIQNVTPVILMSAVQKIINHNGYSQNLYQLKQSTNDSIEIQFQKIEFDRFITLLLLIIKDYNVGIAQVAVTAETTPGIVNANIILKV